MTTDDGGGREQRGARKGERRDAVRVEMNSHVTARDQINEPTRLVYFFSVGNTVITKLLPIELI